MLVFALTLATALHAAGLWVSGKRAPIRIESGAGAAEARLGSSFADMAAGRAQPASNSTVTPNRQADEEVTPTDPGQALRPETPAAADAAPPEEPAVDPAPTGTAHRRTGQEVRQAEVPSETAPALAKAKAERARPDRAAPAASQGETGSPPPVVSDPIDAAARATAAPAPEPGEKAARAMETAAIPLTETLRGVAPTPADMRAEKPRSEQASGAKPQAEAETVPPVESQRASAERTPDTALSAREAATEASPAQGSTDATATPRTGAEQVTRPVEATENPAQKTARQTAPSSEAPAASLDVVAAAPETGKGLQVSRRPKSRPATVEETARAQRADRAARQSRERDRQAERRANSGSNAARNATQGSVTGDERASAARSGRGSVQQTRTSGNAAASNYPGEVMARLSRVPRPKLSSRGAAIVRFSIANDGSLAGVGLARSSGSARLDRAALRVVRRAAPFPHPPSGAQRNFSVRIKSD